jgi:hyperosmotically inducible periplasmic protein
VKYGVVEKVEGKKMKGTLRKLVTRGVLSIAVIVAAIPAMAGNAVSAGSERGDAAIAEAVRKNIVIRSNYGVFDWVEGEVRDGVVTLSGAVRDPLRKAELARAAMSVEGVFRIDNRIEVLPLSTYDDELRIRALRTIYRSSVFDRYALGPNPPIHIIVDNGRVVLRGIVATTLERQVAESLVRNNVLALGITNELQVEKSN